MIARRDLLAEIRRLRSNQPLHCKQLFRSNHFVGASSKKVHWKPQAREIDPLPEGDEAPGGKFIELVEFLDDFEIVCSGNIDCPRVPVLEDGFDLREFRRADRLKRLQRFTDLVCFNGVVSPEPCDIAADDATVAEINQAFKHGQGSSLGDSRQFGLPRSRINRRPRHHELAYLGWESPGIDQRQPASLAEPDEINQATEMIDQDIETGKIVVNAEKSHLGAGRAPIDHEQSFNSGTTEGGNKTVPGGKVGNNSAMQRERRAQEGGNAAFDGGKVTELDGMQLERNLARRGSFRLVPGVVAIDFARESQTLRRYGRRRFTGRRSDERRPEERRVQELTSGVPIHLIWERRFIVAYLS